MQRLKRSWRVLIGVFVLALATSVVWWGGGSASVALGGGDPPEYIAPTNAERGALLGLLDDVDLDRHALAALNLTVEQAVTILGDLRSWYGANRGTLASLNANIATATASVRQAEKAVRMGPPDAEQQEALETARQALAAARQAYDQALGGLKTQLATRLSQSQAATWEVIHHGHGQRMPIRMLALTAQQRVDYGRAWRQFRPRRAAARTPEARAAAVATWEAALATILTDDNRQVIAAYESYVADAWHAVTQAFATVLPAGNVAT